MVNSTNFPADTGDRARNNLDLAWEYQYHWTIDHQEAHMKMNTIVILVGPIGASE